MAAPVLQVTDLVRRFGDHTAVDRVSFQIQPGETYGLLGPNGAGKTTTISMIAGLLTPDSGEVELLGEPLTSGRKSLIGLVPQDIALYPDLSALENLQFFGKLQNLHGEHLKQRIAHVLDVVGLTDRAKDRIDTYSGGMKRRANIAVGLLHEPQLFGSVFGVSQPGAAVQSKKSGPQLQVPPLHSRLSEHEEVHEPQCAVVTFRFTSQPSFASPLQSA